MFATRGQTDDDILQRFIDDLPPNLRPIHLLYERTDLDHLHVWVISERFPADAEARSDLIFPVYRRLHAGVLLRISLFFKMTPAEFEEEYEVSLDDLPAELVRLERPA